jgi:hypothetical protein
VGPIVNNLIQADRDGPLEPQRRLRDSLVAPPATRVAGLQTLTNGVRRVIWRPAVFLGFHGGHRGDPLSRLSSEADTGTRAVMQP